MTGAAAPAPPRPGQPGCTRPGAGSPLRWLAAAGVAAAVLYAAAALLGALPYGVPDNGDFQKYNRRFVAGPAGEGSSLPRTYAEWREAFGARGWHRYWTLRPEGGPGPPPAVGAGTTGLLWRPGLALHRALRPGPVLDVVWIGLLPRLLILLAVAALAAAVALEAAERRAPLLLLAAAPWPFLLTASSSTAYLNTFYREAGTFTYGALFVAALALAPRLGGRPAAALALATGALLVASAPAHGPLAAIVALAAWDLALRRAPAGAFLDARSAAVAAGIAAVLVLGIWRTSAVDPHLRGANAFNSVFLGLLPLSDTPEAHLRRLGLPAESLSLVGRAAFTAESRAWRRLHGERLDHGGVASILRHEPRLVSRAALRAAALANRTSLAGRNLFAEDGPPASGAARWNLWGELQRRYLPRGAGLLVFAPIAIAAGAAATRSPDARVAATGRLVALGAAGALLELALKFAADGPTEPTRHLVAANLFLSASVAALLWLGLQRLAVGRRRRDSLALS